MCFAVKVQTQISCFKEHCKIFALQSFEAATKSFAHRAVEGTSRANYVVCGCICLSGQNTRLYFGGSSNWDTASDLEAQPFSAMGKNISSMQHLMGILQFL